MIIFLFMIRLMIADDHQVLLDGFKSIFDATSDIRVIATAKNGREVLRILEEQTPDVLLMDIKMPDLNGVETCKKAVKLYPDLKVIALSMYDQMSYVKRMFQFGASGYLLKNDSAEIIETAIREVVRGNPYLSPQLKSKMSDPLVGLRGEENQMENISEREKEVLVLLAGGLTDGQIAEKLFLSVHTVNSHRKRILAKFHAKNSAELVRICMEKGII